MATDYEAELAESFDTVLREGSALDEGGGRLQDLADVQRLIQIHRLKKGYAEQLNPYVREAFLDLVV